MKQRDREKEREREREREREMDTVGASDRRRLSAPNGGPHGRHDARLPSRHDGTVAASLQSLDKITVSQRPSPSPYPTYMQQQFHPGMIPQPGQPAQFAMHPGSTVAARSGSSVCDRCTGYGMAPMVYRPSFAGGYPPPSYPPQPGQPPFPGSPMMMQRVR